MAGAALWLVLALAGAARGAGRGLLGAPAAYDLESTLQLNDAARADREVGYKLRARLAVLPRWAGEQDEYLLEFRLLSPKLYLRGKHVNADFMPYESIWDSHSDSTFYAHWSRGEIKVAYLDPNELPDVLNYKKSLLSLFQVQMVDGEYNETDVSGPCQVLYETISTEVFRKIKRSCADSDGALSGARRVARYSLDAPGLRALHAEELLQLGPAALGLKARSWHTLQRAGPAPGPAPGPAALPDALRALPGALRALPLTLQAEPGEAAADAEELSAVLQQAGATLARAGPSEGPGEGGGGAQAAAALTLLPALRRANHSAALQLLQRVELHDHLSGLCRLLGLAGTRAAHAAADDFLQLHAHDPLAGLAQDYLAGFALADWPDEAAVLDVLRLAHEARAPAVRAAALLAVAAAACQQPCAQAVRDALARGLARCHDEPCRALHLRALGNLRRADTADLLLEHAERDEPGAALAALGALGAAPAAALSFARLDRLQALALSAAAALEVRATALDLLVRRRADVPLPLAHVAHQLHERGPHELRRVLWQRVAALAPAHAALRALPRHLPAQLRGWDARAHGGSSAVLARAPGWAAAGWRAELQALQVARGGLLRRGELRLLARDDLGDSFDALTVNRCVDTRSRGFRRRKRRRRRRARPARAGRRGARRRARPQRGRRAPGRDRAVRRTGGVAGPRVGRHGQLAHARAARAVAAAPDARDRGAAGRRARARARVRGAGAGAGRTGAGLAVVAQRARRTATARRAGRARRAAPAHGLGRAERGRRRARRAAPAHRGGPGLLLGRGAVRAREHGGALADALGGAGGDGAAPARAARARLARAHAGPHAGAGPAQRRHVPHAARGRRRGRGRGRRRRRRRTVTRFTLRSHQRLARFCSEFRY